MTIASRMVRSTLCSLRPLALALPFALLATACDDPDQPELVELDDDEVSEALAAADAEEAAEAAEADEADRGGLADQDIDVLRDSPDATKSVVPMCCSITYPSMFNPHVRISNIISEGCGVSPSPPAYATIQYTVSHYYGDPGPFIGYTSGPIAINTAKSVALSHPGSLNAMSCTAIAVW